MIRKIIFFVIILILLGIAGGYYLGANYKFTLQPQNAATTTAPTSTLQLLGGDRDAHGCITSAGYSWCEENRNV